MPRTSIRSDSAPAPHPANGPPTTCLPTSAPAPISGAAASGPSSPRTHLRRGPSTPGRGSSRRTTETGTFRSRCARSPRSGPTCWRCWGRSHRTAGRARRRRSEPESRSGGPCTPTRSGLPPTSSPTSRRSSASLPRCSTRDRMPPRPPGVPREANPPPAGSARRLLNPPAAPAPVRGAAGMATPAASRACRPSRRGRLPTRRPRPCPDGSRVPGEPRHATHPTGSPTLARVSPRSARGRLLQVVPARFGPRAGRAGRETRRRSRAADKALPSRGRCRVRR